MFDDHIVAVAKSILLRHFYVKICPNMGKFENSSNKKNLTFNQASYCKLKIYQWAILDSNQRPLVCETSALTN